MRTHGFELLARVTRGVEWVTQAEVACTLRPSEMHVEHRQVRWRQTWLDQRVLELGTCDDVLLIAGVVDGVDRRRAALAVRVLVSGDRAVLGLRVADGLGVLWSDAGLAAIRCESRGEQRACREEGLERAGQNSDRYWGCVKYVHVYRT
jgi:hypothetical protein